MKNRALTYLAVGLSILLGACGGGGGGGGGSSPGTATYAPYIEALLLSFPTGGVPSGYGQNGYNSVASVWVTDRAGGSPIANATVSINGVSLDYLAADQSYEAAVNVAPGEAVTLSVTVGGTTYTTSSTQYSAYPTITSPASGTTWSSQASNLIQWSGVSPTSDSSYALAVTDTNGGLVWPSSSFLGVSSSTTSAVVGAGSLTTGNRLVVVGLEKGVSIPGAATDSVLVIGGFTYSPITVTNGPTSSLVSIAVTPANPTVANGQTHQMTATGTYSNASTQDLTTQVTWSSSDPSKATISNTGLVTAVAYGSATITATSGGVSNSTVVTVFQPTPSPTPPLSQAVAYQIDYAHSGRAVFADAVTFPTTTPAWSVTLDGDVSYPLIAGGSVYVVTSSKSLYALDASTGNVIWGPIVLSGSGSWAGHAYDNGKLFVINADGLLKSFDAGTGNAGWSTQLDQTSFSAVPTAINGIVYVGGSGGGGTLYAVDASNGNVLWHSSVANGGSSSPTASGDRIFVSYPCQTYAFGPISGSSQWHYNGGCGGGGGRTAAYANGRLYARDWTTPTGNIFDAANGTLVGTFTSTPIPAFSTQTGYFLSSGTLSARSLSSDSLAWTFTGDGSLVSAPILVNSVVVIGSSSGNVYALDAASGTQVWSAAAGAAIVAPDEMDTFKPLSGLAAGEGYLVVPAGSRLTAWRITGP